MSLPVTHLPYLDHYVDRVVKLRSRTGISYTHIFGAIQRLRNRKACLCLPIEARNYDKLSGNASSELRKQKSDRVWLLRLNLLQI